MSSSQSRILEQSLRHALKAGRERLYYHNPWFYHWVHRRAQLLVEELTPEIHEAVIDAENRQAEADERYQKLIHGDEF